MKVRVVKLWHAKALRFLFVVEVWREKVWDCDDEDDDEPRTTPPDMRWLPLYTDEHETYFDTQGEATAAAQLIVDHGGETPRALEPVVVGEWGSE